MKTKLQAQILFLLAACLFVLTVAHTSLMNAQNNSLPRFATPPPPLQLIQSPDAEQRENGASALIHSHEDEEDRVQAIAETFLKHSAQRRAANPRDPMNQEGNQDDREAADSIEMLGELRSTRSIPFLVKHLTLFIFVEHIPIFRRSLPLRGGAGFYRLTLP